MTQLITCTPAMPRVGETVRICWSGTFPVQLDLQWTPPGLDPDVLEFPDPDVPCIDFVVPAGAWSLVINDTSGQSDDLPVAIAP